MLELEGQWAPELGDVTSSYTAVRGFGTAYLSADDTPLKPSLAFRAGGEKVWGDYPYFDAAYVGGFQTVRGFAKRRFAGDASLYGSAEARFSLFHFLFLMPGELGVFGLGDVGRVFLDGEDSDQWHTGVGGGLSINQVDVYAISVAFARSNEENAIYFTMGMQF